MPHWSEIKPYQMKRKDDHHWLFAEYVEFPWETGDGSWLSVFLFRNKERTVFGIRKWEGLIHRDDLRKMATKIIQDAEYRKSLISDDPNVPKMWRRR
jgi:hypothetical protein